jgi:hypothetical protein
VAAKRRGLGDVLHYFIPEEEQAEARRASESRRPGTPASGRVRWLLCAEPARPLSCALAVDLAAALGDRGVATEILSPFAPPFSYVAPSDVPWRAVTEPPRARQALNAVRPGAGALLVVPAAELRRWFGEVAIRDALEGILVSVDAAARGLPQAMTTLRELPDLLPAQRIGALVVGAADEESAARLFRRLAGAASRQLGLDLEPLGGLSHDRASFRSLLRGRSVLEVDAESASARSIREVSVRLVAQGA